MGPVEALEAAFSRGLDEGMHKLRDVAVEMSSGPYSLATLAKMDHPYARRHGSPRLPAGKINVQSGRFRSAWRVPLPFLHLAGEFDQTLVNDDPVADYLKYGTKFMFMRPVDKEVEARGEAILEAAILEELARFEQQDFVIE